MKRLTIILFSVCAFPIFPLFAAHYSWEHYLVNGDYSGLDYPLQTYGMSVNVDEEEKGRVMHCGGNFIGYEVDGLIYIKQQDQNTTPMPVGNDYWALAFNGDVLSEETILAMTAIPLCDWYDTSQSGGVTIGDRDDVYLAFLTDRSRVDDDGSIIDGTWVGWLHVSIDNELNMSVLDAAVNLDGGPIIVGFGSIPEPTSAALLVLGVGVLFLRRRIEQEI